MLLGENEARDLLQETLDEEGAVAESIVNEDAEEEEEGPATASRFRFRR
ncbi:MAG: hypothetical protein ABIU29_07425 [Chthoniobacterales bacterium]